MMPKLIGNNVRDWNAVTQTAQLEACADIMFCYFSTRLTPTNSFPVLFVWTDLQ